VAPWLIPALKAVLPHVGTIIGAATPVFTRKKAEAANQVQEQITELQSAVSQNSAHIKELAAQLQTTVTALEQAATLAESRVRRLTWLCAAAIVLAAAALVTALR
jgi:methyl-accepting chemotaxis protein